MKRHEWWRAQYNADRYLQGFEGTILRERTSDVLANMLEVSDELKLRMPLPVEGNDFWMISWTHLLEEWGHHGGLPAAIEKRLPRLDWPGLASAVEPFKTIRERQPNSLIRYGHGMHLRESLTRGLFRISPASKYKDPSLNIAIRDDELSLTVYRRSRLYTLLYDRHGGVLALPGPVKGIRREQLKAISNYYVYCLAMEPSLRLFGDFEYAAAIAIPDALGFVRSLGEAVRKLLGPGWTWFAGPVRYVDPLRAPTGRLDIVRSKHFSFAYQREYRIIWLPASPVKELDYISVTIDPLDRLGATLVEL